MILITNCLSSRGSPALAEEYFKQDFGIKIYIYLITFCQRKWYPSLFPLPRHIFPEVTGDERAHFPLPPTHAGVHSPPLPKLIWTLPWSFFFSLLKHRAKPKLQEWPAWEQCENLSKGQTLLTLWLNSLENYLTFSKYLPKCRNCLIQHSTCSINTIKTSKEKMAIAIAFFFFSFLFYFIFFLFFFFGCVGSSFLCEGFL